MIFELYSFVYGLLAGAGSVGLLAYFLPNLRKKDGLYITFYWHKVRIELSPEEITELVVSAYHGVGNFFTNFMKKLYLKAEEKSKEEDDKNNKV